MWLGRKDVCAFTLVELLVVIAIIGLLMSLVVPGLRTAQQQARRVACAGNLRSLGSVFHLIGIDNHGYNVPNYRQPYWYRWIENMGSVITFVNVPPNSPAYCPEDRVRNGLPNPDHRGDIISRSYGISYSRSTGSARAAGQAPLLPDGSRQVFQSEAALRPALGLLVADHSRDTAWRLGTNPDSASSGWVFPHADGFGTNVLFLDGHVELRWHWPYREGELPLSAYVPSGLWRNGPPELIQLWKDFHNPWAQDP